MTDVVARVACAWTLENPFATLKVFAVPMKVAVRMDASFPERCYHLRGRFLSQALKCS